jgi:hypothetical protein
MKASAGLGTPAATAAGQDGVASGCRSRTLSHLNLCRQKRYGRSFAYTIDIAPSDTVAAETSKANAVKAIAIAELLGDVSRQGRYCMKDGDVAITHLPQLQSRIRQRNISEIAAGF